MKNQVTSLIIADDHPIYRQGLVRIVESTQDFRLLGEAGDGRRALDLIEQRTPEVAVIDVSMPALSGLEVMKTANAKRLTSDFVVLTMYKEEEYFNESMDLGAKGYLLKESAPADLLECLRTVASGGYYVSPLLSSYLIKRTASRDSLRTSRPGLELLTTAERQVLKYIAQNMTSKEIAKQLHISFRTVQNHRANICSKLKLEGHNKLLQFALEHRDLL